jgi:glycosyltransferase involved in cell wall biosynthesis
VGFCALVKRDASPDVLEELGAFPTFQQGIHDTAALNPYPAEWGTLRGMYDFLGSNDRFARDLEAGLQGRVGAGDVVFLPNATPRQILGLALLLRKNPVYRLLHYVLLMRYSVNLAMGPITARKNHLDSETAQQYAFSFEKLLAAGAPGAIRLTTDSRELADEYARLAKRPVEVLPIPHTSHEVDSVPPVGVPTKSKTKLRAVFLGDARDEKGFELLPALARACAHEPWASRTELVLQAYVSSEYHMPMGTVIEELSKLKASNVHLIGEALGADAYQYLLASADLVLLPYDALTYRSRTSGPFMEAICAGKPVVVPAKSWMAAQLNGSGAGRTFVSGNSGDFVSAALGALQNHAEHARAAETLGKQYREFHNPANFVRALLTPSLPK